MVTGLATILVWACAASELAARHTGTIEGVVVNASQGDWPEAGAEVILQVRLEGEFAPVERTRSDALGRFRFDNLPVGPEALYLPGATRDEIFYPGRRVELSSTQRTAHMIVKVHDTVRRPNPLVIRQHEVVLRAERGVLQVVEAMLIDNPGTATYVGSGSPDSTMMPTFRLGIPSDFTRLTFEKEFFGRQFRVVDGQVLTNLPWTPGQHWVRFTYTIPNEDAHRVWEHRLDVPCENLLIRVQHGRPEEIASSLGVAARVAQGEALFEFSGEQLAGREVVQITLGKLPRTWTFYARWSALAVLLGLAIVTVFWRRLERLRRNWRGTHPRPLAPPIQQLDARISRTPSRSRKRRRRAA